MKAIRELIAKVGEKVFALIVAGIAAPIVLFLAGWLPAFGEVAYAPPPEVVLGDRVKLNPTIVPKWWTIYHSKLDAQHSANLSPRGEVVFPLPPVKETMQLSKLRAEILEFDSTAVGEASVNLLLLSGTGRKVSEKLLKYTIVPHRSYEGEWALSLGDRSCRLMLHKYPKDEKGVYGMCFFADASPPYLVNGEFDGTSFVGTMIFGDSPARISIKALTSEANGVLTAAGKAEFLLPESGGWTPGGDAGDFRMSKKVG